MKTFWIFVGIAGVILIAVIIFLTFFQNDSTQQKHFSPSASPQTPAIQTATPTEQIKTLIKSVSIQAPVAQFQQRITKKPFGIFITPKNSPVQPERFSGYHTGVDVEYGDVSGDIMVSAIADGTVVVSKQATGYGGVVGIEHVIDGKKVVAIYGHLDPKELPTNGTHVTIGQQIGILGDGETSETDGERKHLHFALSTSTGADIRGYVQQKEELSGWLDPVETLGLK